MFSSPVSATYKKIAWQFVLLLLIYQSIRLLFFSFNHSYFPNVDFTQYCYLAFHAIRFDLSAIFAINLLYLLLALLPFSFVSQKWYVGILNLVFILTNSIAFLFDLADIGYFPYVRKRMTAEVFNLIEKKSDFIDLLPSYLSEFWYVPLAAILLITVFIFVNKKIQSNYQSVFGFSLKSLLLYFLTIGVSIIAIRGGLQLKPILNINALLVASNEQTPLVLNTPFSILHTLEEKKLTRLNDYTEKEILMTFNPIKNYADGTNTNQYNVVVIILESFGKQYTSLGGRKSYTPFLDSLMKSSLVCKNAFANAYCSAEGIPACLTGIPSFMDEAFTTSPYSNNKIEALPYLLKKIGYTSSFFHGGTNGTMSFDIFTKNAGFDKYVGRTEYNNDQDYDGTWGIWDEPFLQFYANELEKEKQPFFSSVFTLSSHEPFHLPDSYKNSSFAKLKGIERGITYTDMSLRKFFETASTKSWYQHTLFVITADHNFLANNDSVGFYNTGLGLYSIPMLFFNPSDKKLASIENKIVQQIDILPSILDYLDYPTNFFAYGTSVFDTNSKHFAYTQMSGHYQWHTGDYVLVSDNGFTDGIYHYQKDSMLQHRLQNETVNNSMTQHFNMFRQLLHNTIIDNRQTVEGFQNKTLPFTQTIK